MTKTEIPKSSQDGLGRWLARIRNERVAREIVPPFLDIACGDNMLVKRLGDGIGVDVANHGTADLVVRDLGSLPFVGGAFNSIAIVAALNYMPDPSSVLSECARVLRPRGRLIVTMLHPIPGRVWHLLREKWASRPGFSFRELEAMTSALPLKLRKRSRFMLGLNGLYVYEKHE